MLAERILQDPKELLSIVDNWSKKGERLLVYEKGDTLVLKRMNKGLSAFADDSSGDRMSMEEVVREVHQSRHS